MIKKEQNNNDFSVKQVLNKFYGAKKSRNLCIQNRKASELSFDVEMLENLSELLKDNESFFQRYQRYRKNVLEVIQSIERMPLGECLEYLLKYTNTSKKQLHLNSGISERTITRYLSGVTKIFDKRIIVALIRALNIPMEITNVLLKQASIAFSNSYEDELLQNVLQCFRGENYRKVDEFLIAMKNKPLVNYKK